MSFFLFVIANQNTTGPYRCSELILLLILLLHPCPCAHFFFLFLLLVLFLEIWREAEVRILIPGPITPQVSRQHDKGSSGERGHIVTTGDLNRRLQSFAVTVQQSNRVQDLTGWTDTEIVALYN